MNGIFVLALLVISTSAQLNQVADVDGTLYDCEFSASASNCCTFKRYDEDEDFAMCMGGSAWNQALCACSDAEEAGCDVTSCGNVNYVEAVDTLCQAGNEADLAANGGCCQNGRLYNAVDGNVFAYSFNGAELDCPPVQNFDLTECSCVGEALMETAAP